MTPRIGMVWAQARGRVLGDGSGMPWHLPEDLRHFKEVTLGAPVIMGRRTWESLDPRFRPLPGRRNIVITRGGAACVGAESAPGVREALRVLDDAPVAWIIGGGQIYREGMPLADECIVTDIDMDAGVDPAVAVTAPELDPGQWAVAEQGPWLTSEKSAPVKLRYRFTTYRRR